MPSIHLWLLCRVGGKFKCSPVKSYGVVKHKKQNSYDSGFISMGLYQNINWVAKLKNKIIVFSISDELCTQSSRLYFVVFWHWLIWPISHDDVIKWKYFPRHWPFVREIHRSPMDSPHKGQWRGDLMFFFYLRLNTRLSKQSRRWWFETPLR